MLFNNGNSDRQRMLDVVIHHDDTETAMEVLRTGLKPDGKQPPSQSTAMRVLLGYASKLPVLYENSPVDLTELDQALQQWNLAEARRLLQISNPAEEVAPLWKNAVESGRHDILRAILLLGYASGNPNFRVLQGGLQIHDTAIKKVLKEFPYFSPKRNVPLNFNGKIRFAGTEKMIECRHLAIHRLDLQARHPELKLPDNLYANAQAVAFEVPLATEERYANLVASAKVSHLISNRRFGQFLARQFVDLEKSECANRLMVMTSANHAMTISLRLKKGNNSSTYVIQFFDPNWTTSPARFAALSLSSIEDQSLDDYIAPNFYKHYFPDGHEVSMIFEYPITKEHSDDRQPLQHEIVDRTLTTCIADENINEACVFYMLKEGFGGDLRRLKSKLEALPPEKRVALLAAKDPKGTPGIFIAMQRGNKDAIDAWQEMLPSVPADAMSDLLAGQRRDGTSALFMAMQAGRAKAILSWSKPVMSLPRNEREKLAIGEGGSGISSLYIAMQNGHDQAIDAWTTLARSGSIEFLEACATAKGPDGTGGLFAALDLGHANAIRAWWRFAEPVLHEKVASLLTERRPDGLTGLFLALAKDHAEAIKALGEILHILNPAEVADILSTRDASGKSGLVVALARKNVKAVSAYLESCKP